MSGGLFGLGMGFIALLVPLVAVTIVVLGTILWIWMIIDCAMNEPSEGNDKIIWILIIVLAHGLGALIYFLARRPQRMARYGR